MIRPAPVSQSGQVWTTITTTMPMVRLRCSYGRVADRGSSNTKTAALQLQEGVAVNSLVARVKPDGIGAGSVYRPRTNFNVGLVQGNGDGPAGGTGRCKAGHSAPQWLRTRQIGSGPASAEQLGMSMKQTGQRFDSVSGQRPTNQLWTNLPQPTEAHGQTPLCLT